MREYEARPGEHFAEIRVHRGCRTRPRRYAWRGAHLACIGDSADRSGAKLDIALFVPSYDQHQAKLVDIALDHLIGEYDVATKLGAISITTADRVPAFAKPFAELPSDIDALGSGT